MDKAGKTMDFLLRAKRDVAAAEVFFRWAFENQGRPPRKIALQGYQASRRAAREVFKQHSARRLRSTASNSCIASGKVNSPRVSSEPLEKTAPEICSAALGPLTSMNARDQSLGHS
jgi:transposase-like protein